MLLIFRNSNILLLLFILIRTVSSEGNDQGLRSTNNTTSQNIKIENKYFAQTESVKSEATHSVHVVDGETSTEEQRNEEYSAAMEASTTTIQGSVSMGLLDIYGQCKANMSCIEERLLTFIEELDKRKTIPLLSNVVTVEKITTRFDAPKSKEGLIPRLHRFLLDHSIGIDLPDEEDDGSDTQSADSESESLGSTRNLGEGRRRKKLKKQQKILMPIIVLMEVAWFIIVPNILWALFQVTGIGVVSAFIGILVSTFFALQSIWQDKESNPGTTVTLVKPHVVPEIYHSGLIHPWSRSTLLDPYRGYGPSP